MTYQQKDNSGAIFKNDRREKDTHPHMKGTIVVAGVEYWISAWTNTSEKGVRYQSLSVQPKQEMHDQGMRQVSDSAGTAGDGIIPARGQETYAQPAPVDDFEDDIPF